MPGLAGDLDEKAIGEPEPRPLQELGKRGSYNFFS